MLCAQEIGSAREVSYVSETLGRRECSVFIRKHGCMDSVVNLPLSNVSDSAISFLLLWPARQRRRRCNHFLLEPGAVGCIGEKKGGYSRGCRGAEEDVCRYCIVTV